MADMINVPIPPVPQMHPNEAAERPPTPGGASKELEVDDLGDFSLGERTPVATPGFPEDDDEVLPGLNGQDGDEDEDLSAAVTRVDSLVPPSQGPMEVEEAAADKGGDEDEDSSDDDVVIPSPPKKPRGAIVAKAVVAPPNPVVVAKVFVAPTGLELECTKALAACIKSVNWHKRRGGDHLSRLKSGYTEKSKKAKEALSDAQAQLARLNVEKEGLGDDQGAIRKAADEKIAAIGKRIEVIEKKLVAKRKTASGAIDATRRTTADVLNYWGKQAASLARNRREIDRLRLENAQLEKEIVEINTTTWALVNVCEGTGVLDSHVRTRLDAAMRDDE